MYAYVCVLSRVFSSTVFAAGLLFTRSFQGFPHLTKGMLGVQIGTTESTQLGIGNAGPRACTANILPTEPSPSLLPSLSWFC